ncbi:MAG: phenylalanine--tRNA ligase subunit alpha [Acidimicrobiales bacterium]|nr:phenylalanine--tRNA ligase subunit alpha [Acidimicrobiales bacterium]
MPELSSTDAVLAELNGAVEAIVANAEEAGDIETLDSLESGAFGKAGPIASARKAIGEVPPHERKLLGLAVQESKTAVETAIASRRGALVDGERSRRLEAERMDLSEVVGEPRVGHIHPLTQAWEELEDTFIGMGFRIAEGPHVETDWHNFDALNIPKGHPARDAFDSLYVNNGDPGSTVLRTHTSPVQIRTMLEDDPPIYIVAPGRVFRRDTADATHLPVFHQIEGLVIDRTISLADLAGTIEEFTQAFFGKGFHSRLRPNYFPFTEPSAEFDIQRPDGSWLELGGCGVVHPHVLKAGGIDPEEWSGFAFGFGIDRFLTIKHGVDDLRDAFTNDVRFLEQF